MDRQKREDLLEAALTLQRKGVRITPEGLATLVCREGSEVENDLIGMKSAGEVSSGPEGEYLLTSDGQKVAEQTERKHRLLQEFFSRVLGMDHESASKEACTLEHAVSEEAISRINRFISDAPCCKTKGGRTGPQSLVSVPEGTTVRVIAICGCQRQQRLLSLGILPGTLLSVLRTGGGHTLLVRVRDAEIALSREIAHSVHVEPVT